MNYSNRMYFKGQAPRISRAEIDQARKEMVAACVALRASGYGDPPVPANCRGSEDLFSLINID